MKDMFDAAKAPPDTPDARESVARAQGYRPTGGGQAVRYRGHIPEYTSLDASFAPKPKASLMDQMQAALQSDAESMQGAANRQFERVDTANQRFGQAVEEAPGPILAESERASGELGGLAKDFRGFGEDAVTRFDTRSKSIMADLEGDLKRSAGFTDAAVGAAESAVSGFNGRYQENVKAMVSGLERRVSQQMRQLESGVDAQGNPLPPAAIQQMRRELTFDVGQQVASVTAQMWGEAQKTLASLRMNLAAVRGQAASESNRSAEIRASTGTELGRQEAQAQAERMRAGEIRAQLGQFSASLRASARALATQMLVNGREAMANLLRNNPESVVSIFSGLAQMVSVATAGQGGGGGGPVRRGTTQSRVGVRMSGGSTPWQGSGGNPSNMAGGYSSPQRLPNRMMDMAGPSVPNIA
jgi:hypothetical protein